MFCSCSISRSIFFELCTFKKKKRKRIKMLKKICNSSLSPILIGLLSIVYSCYWLFLSTDNFWRSAIGVYNIVYLCFFIVLALVAILLSASGNVKWYTIFSFVSFIPAVIVCFMNRYARYPDFESMATQYLQDNSAEPVATYINSMFAENWKFYDFIVSRSGKASTTLGVLLVVWAALLFYPFIKKDN